MNRIKISYPEFKILAGDLIDHDVENEHPGVIGATYINRYQCLSGGIVEERGGNGGCDYFLERQE